MKKLFVILLTAATLSACNNSEKAADTTSADSAGVTKADPAIIKFNEESFDFGKITEGEKTTHVFKFYNGSTQPLIITNAVASCGCTTPTWPKDPVLPGKEGEISVTFNSAGKVGLQDKLITVTANTDPAQTVVHLIGEVLAKK
ncbi:DUF1573 domain-containing protein [Mucilaginibacter auburnensis]|uniref:Uncharacterized protein DUF1573 n=1 Tax=Mucilaginibacter auburnensis TaxID=1457233 RepID=A0A2H9VU28_9SPHI|nr:DUF1573 domain-containing protein [Mucilaginibacter auburnensis]PJJ84327.1 uncharacterized protein DUF1573 [Mucilaginibacter auburnensis]